MNRIHLLIAIHSHQPVGNFDWVFEEATEKAYRPFLDVLEKFPRIRVGLHFSGCLLDWMADHHGEILARIKGLVERGQVEIISGGYYEPILPLIPDRDKVGQIQMLNRFIREELGGEPKGAWIAERVWEPGLVRPLAEAGLRYTIVDDSHFEMVGLSPEEVHGYYVSEEEGRVVAIYPGSQKLRYLIPFRKPEETIEYLRQKAASGAGAVLYADDGEKFGLWPGTHGWVYGEKWLEKFFHALEANADWISVTPPGEYLQRHPATGRVYLPCASYREMLEWSKGYFRNFLVKYPEANHMHKRMLQVSGRLARVSREKARGGASAVRALEKTRRELYKAQCNCSYWHGIFGGLYLGHLRSAVYSHLIESEKGLDALEGRTAPAAEISDWDCDGRPEALLSSSGLALAVDPDEGGGVFEIDYRPRSVNVVNTLARRPEPYHQALWAKEALEPVRIGAEGSEPQSIHERKKVKEEGLADYLHYDAGRRGCFLDHCFPPTVTLRAFAHSDYDEAGDFFQGSYDIVPEKARATKGAAAARLLLQREGTVRLDGRALPLRIEKSFALPARGKKFETRYRLVNLGSERLTTRFGVEFNFSLRDAHYNKLGEAAGVRRLEMHDSWAKVAVDLAWDREATLWHFPVETVSDSEAGLERTYQELCLVAVFPVELAGGGQLEIQFETQVGDL